MSFKIATPKRGVRKDGLLTKGAVPTWIEGTTFAVTEGVVAAGGGSGDDFGDGPTNGTDLLFINTVYPQYTPPLGVWHTINIADFNIGIPADAKAVLLNAICIISHGESVEDADMMVQFKQTGSAPPAEDTYVWQVIEPFVSGGERCTSSVWVAVENLRFDYWWNILPSLGTWPTTSAYGLHVFANAYIR